MNFNPWDIVTFEDFEEKDRDRVVKLMDNGKSFAAAVKEVAKEIERREAK